MVDNLKEIYRYGKIIVYENNDNIIIHYNNTYVYHISKYTFNVVYSNRLSDALYDAYEDICKECADRQRLINMLKHKLILNKACLEELKELLDRFDTSFDCNGYYR